MQQSSVPIIGGVIWLLSAIAAIILVLKNKINQLWAINLVGFIAFFIFVITPFSHLVDVERQLPLRQLANSVVQVRQPTEELIMLSKGFAKPSLVFYTHQHVTYLLQASEVLPYIQQKLTQSDVKSVLLVTPSRLLPKTGLTPNQYQQINSAGIYQLVRIAKGLEK